MLEPEKMISPCAYGSRDIIYHLSISFQGTSPRSILKLSLWLVLPALILREIDFLGFIKMTRHSIVYSARRHSMEYSVTDPAKYQAESKIADTPAAPPRPKSGLISAYEYYNTYYLTESHFY